jgi:hypothetical protein
MPRREVIHWLTHAMGLPACGVGFWGNLARASLANVTTTPSEVTCRRCLAIIAKRKGAP